MGLTAAILMAGVSLMDAVNAGGATWRLESGDTRIEIRVENNRPVVSTLEDVASRHSWAGAGMAETLMPSVGVNGVETPTAWVFRRGSQNKRAGTLTLTFDNAQPKLELRSVWRARPGHGPIEHWIEIANQSAATITVSDQDSLTLDALTVEQPATAWWVKRGGSNASTEGGTCTEALSAATNLNLVSNCDDGASPVPWMAIQAGESHGLYIGWEFSGLGRIEAKGMGRGLAVRVGNLADFKTDIASGETFHVPPAFVGCYIGDIDEGSYRLHRFVIEKLRPKAPRGFADPTLAYNLYLDAGGPEAREADVLRSAQFCKDIGFETFMPDAMWFPEAGDWRWDPKRFPNGIAPIEKFIHKNHMKMALWCAWTNGGISTDPEALSVRGPAGHPDWFNADYAADWKPGPFYGGQICLASPDAKAWALRKTQWLVANHKLDYLKHDCGPIVMNCNKTTHRHKYGVDASYWATLGYYEVQEKLREAHPRVILENCSGGGHIKDYGVIQRTHYTVTTDTLSNLPDRQSIYDSTYALPPIVLQAYTYENYYKVPGDGPGNYLWRSAMMGAWQIDPTSSKTWTEAERASAIRSVEIYKTWIRPMLRDVKVHHVLPRPDGLHWDGLFYWSPKLKRGTLYVFRPNSPEGAHTVALKGLDPIKDYWVWGEDKSVPPGVRTGRALMSDGLAVTLPATYTSDPIYVRDAALGKPK